MANSYPITVHDLDGQLIFANQQYRDTLGAGQPLVLEPNLRLKLALDQQWNGRLRHAGRLTDTTATMLPAAQGASERILCVHHDITEHATERDTLLASAERMQHVLAMSTDLYWEQDDKRRFTVFTGRHAWVVENASNWIGKEREQVPDATVVESDNEVDGHLHSMRALQPIRDLVMRVRDPKAPDGVRWFKIYGEPFFDAKGRFKGYRGIGSDITDHAQQRQDLLLSKGVDHLTGLRNRQQTVAALDKLLRDRPDQSLSLIMLEIDGFRTFADAIGASQGNAMLQSITTTLLTAIGPADFVARTGEHEFAIVRPNCSAVDCLPGMLEGVRNCLGERALDAATGVPACTVSIGAASFPADGATAQELLRNAELALQTTRQRGGNGATLYDQRFRTNILRHHRAVRGVSDALRENQLFMVYQPVVNPQARTVVGAEALLRWRHPELGVLAPGFFIDALSNKLLAAKVGQFVMEEVVRQAAQWRRDGVTLGRVAFNVMQADFVAPGFATRLASCMRRWGADPADICVEVTEGMFLGADAGSILQEIRALADMKVEVAFDDFGTGFASLAHLRLPTSRIKIDRSFISNLTANTVDREIVTAVLTMGRAIGKHVTAEGIETAEQRDLLLELGCDTHQGFLYSKGIDAADIPSFVSQFEIERA